MAGQFGGVGFGGTTPSLNSPRQRFVLEDAFATPEERHGGLADPSHGIPGEIAQPYPWEEFPGQPHGPYGIDNQLLGVDVCLLSEDAGQLVQDPTADLQPITRAAPWPKGTPQGVTPDDLQDRHAQTAEIHATGMGAAREALYLPTADPVQDRWVEYADVDAGNSIQERIPGQVAGASGGWGTRDRVQSLAGQNQYGYDAAHLHRRVATGSIPGNTDWMRPGGRVVQKSIAGGATIPTGPDSPFSAQDGTVGYDSRGAVLTQLPAQYVASPEPARAPTYPAVQAESQVDFW